MTETKKKYPFWVAEPKDIQETLKHLKKGTVHCLGLSGGNRPIDYVCYGEKEDYGRKANYSSACGAKNPKYYADRTGKRPTILIIGGTHGQETEGTMAIMNLISLLETGVDLRGKPVSEVTEALAESNPRLILIPVYNMDGRCRCVPDSMLEETPESLRYHGQGTWKDGSLCGWPDCKAVHPILESAGFLGAYYNDDGVNLMHDNFFAPMAKETEGLLRLCDEEAPECVIGLHGGSNCINLLLQPAYVPLETKEAVLRLSRDVAMRQEEKGLLSCIKPVNESIPSPPPSFNLTSAIHHVCGAVSSTYESNEGLLAKGAFGAEDILQHHYCLFVSLFRLAWRKKEQE